MPGTVYPARCGRDSLLEFEWIQFMLDTCSSVEEVRERAGQVAIAPDRVEMHFLLADAGGHRMLLEFRDGETLAYSGSTFQPSAVTNSWYDESMRYASRFDGCGGTSRLSPTSTESLDRFARLAMALRHGADSHASEMPGKAMRLLDSVADSTLLSAVFHPVGGTMQFKTSRNANLRHLKLSAFDFSAGSPRMMLDIHAETAAIN